MARNLSANDIYDIWESYRPDHDEWAVEAANDEDFYMGNQWTKDDAQKLREKGMAPLVVNRVMPVIQQEMAIFLSRRPVFKYFPVGDDDVEKGKLFSDISTHVWEDSNGDIQIDNAARDYFVTGAGYMLGYTDPYADEGRGEVKFKHVPVWDVYPDPNSREIDLSDARFIFISRLIDKDTLIFGYPDKAAVIRAADTEDGSMTDRPGGNNYQNGVRMGEDVFYSMPGGKGKCRVIEAYRKIKVKRIKLFDTLNGIESVVDPKTFDKNTLPKTTRFMPFWETAIEVTVIVGKAARLDYYTLPMEDYPIVPMFLHHNGNPFPRGDVAIIKGMQQEVNKRRSIMIHNAAQSSNFRWLVEKGTVPDKYEWETRGGAPGKVLEYVRSSMGDKPQQVLPGQLSSSWIELEQAAKGDMEYAVSIFAHMMGSSQDAPETYRALLSLEEAGQRKLRFKTNHARAAIRQLGRVIMRLAQFTYTAPKMIRIIGEESNVAKKLFLNQPVIDPLTKRVLKMNDPTIGKYDLVVEDGMSMPTNRMALLQMYIELYKLGIIDKSEVLKKTDVVNREEVLERMGEIQQLNGQLQQMQETIKSEQGLNQTLRRELQQVEVKLGTQAEVTKVKDKMRQTVVAQEVTQARLKDQVNLMKQNMKLDAKKQEMSLSALIIREEMKAEAERLKMKQEAVNEREPASAS